MHATYQCNARTPSTSCKPGGKRERDVSAETCFPSNKGAIDDLTFEQKAERWQSAGKLDGLQALSRPPICHEVIESHLSPGFDGLVTLVVCSSKKWCVSWVVSARFYYWRAALDG